MASKVRRISLVPLEPQLNLSASPRDAITISRTLADGATLLDVTTSLPRSPDEPPYLRPTPPYVRSQVHCTSISFTPCMSTLNVV